jgi:ubiquinol-cytochrome c reductase cytochrome b subunit
MRYRPSARWFFVFFVFACVGLGFCGANEPDAFVFKTGADKLEVTFTDANGHAGSKVYDDFAQASTFKASLPATSGAGIAVKSSGFKWVSLSQILGAYYFLYFLVVLPLLGVIEKPKARPASIADSVHKRSSSTKSSAGIAAAPQHAE